MVDFLAQKDSRLEMLTNQLEEKLQDFKKDVANG
jgi:hypothetical protein